MSVNTLQSPKNSWIPVGLVVFGVPFLRESPLIGLGFFIAAALLVPILQVLQKRQGEPLPDILAGFTSFEPMHLQISFKNDGGKVVCVRSRWRARLTKTNLILSPTRLGFDVYQLRWNTSTDYLVIPLLDIVENRLVEGHELFLRYLDLEGQAVDVHLWAKFPLDTMRKTMQVVSEQHHGVGF